MTYYRDSLYRDSKFGFVRQEFVLVGLHTHWAVDDLLQDVIIACQRPVTALAVNSCLPYQLAVGCADSTVRIYDRRMLVTKANAKQTNAALSLPPLTVPTFKDRSYRITSLCFSPEGEDILVSYSSDHLYLFNVKVREYSIWKEEYPTCIVGYSSFVADRGTRKVTSINVISRSPLPWIRWTSQQRLLPPINGSALKISLFIYLKFNERLNLVLWDTVTESSVGSWILWKRT